ncbi:MAG: hypothetical protein U9R60_06060 [Bacteroidota bacterium]|nr:hypothetical protein [Bacteroidota bacterium]
MKNRGVLWLMILALFVGLTFVDSPVFAKEADIEESEYILNVPDIIGDVFWPNGQNLQDVKVKVIIMDRNCIRHYVETDWNGFYHIDVEDFNWPNVGRYYLRVRFVANGTRYDSCWNIVDLDGIHQQEVDLYLRISPLCPEIICRKVKEEVK